MEGVLVGHGCTIVQVRDGVAYQVCYVSGLMLSAGDPHDLAPQLDPSISRPYRAIESPETSLPKTLRIRTDACRLASCLIHRRSRASTLMPAAGTSSLKPPSTD